MSSRQEEIRNLEEQVALKRSQMGRIQADLSATAAIIEKYDSSNKAQLTPDQLSDWRSAIDHHKECTKALEEEIQTVHILCLNLEKMRRAEKADANPKKGNDDDNKSFMSMKSEGTTVNMIRVRTEEELLDLKKTYDTDFLKLEDEIEDLQDELKKSGSSDDKVDKQDRLERLQKLLVRAKRNYAMQVKQINAACEIAIKKNEAMREMERDNGLRYEIEPQEKYVNLEVTPKKEEKQVDQLPEKIANPEVAKENDKVSNWLDEISQPEQSQRRQPPQLQPPPLFPRPTLFQHPMMTQQPPMFQRPTLFQQPVMTQQPPLFQQPPPQRQEIMDKDSMLMNLMQSQINCMKKMNISPTDRFLPEFSGDPVQWGNFNAAFQRTQSKHEFDNGENMVRLQKALKGKAREAVEHLMANVNNVPQIMETLSMRYGRPEFVLDSLVERAKLCKRPDQTKPDTIVEFGTAVQSLVTTIKSYDEMDYVNNRQLVTELVEKLPGNMKGSWFEWLEEDVGRKTNLLDFSKWLEKKTRVAIRQIKPTVGPDHASEEKNGSRSRKTPGSINASEGEEKSKERTERKCIVCNKTRHGIESCWALKEKTLDERWKIVKQARVCFCCLKAGHQTMQCPDGKVCGVGGCDRKHHQLLHSNVRRDAGSVPPVPLPPTPKQDDSTAAAVKNMGSNGMIASKSYIDGMDGPLPIVTIRVRGKNGRVRITHALLDSGATRTLIGKNLAEELQLDGVKDPYSYRLVTGEIITDFGAKRVNLEVSGKYKNAKMYPLTDAVTVKQIDLAPYSIDVEGAKLKWPHLRRYKGSSLKKVVPEIVIGGDHGFLMMHKQLLYTTIQEPVGIRTVLGWVLQGKLMSSNQVGGTFCIEGVPLEATLDDLIRESYKLDDYGVKNEDDKKMSIQDQRALKIMEHTTRQRDDGRWETGLLWKDNLPFPDTSYEDAFIRLTKTKNRMARDPDFALVYNKKIEEYLEKGYLRKLSEQEAAMKSPRTFYLPHFGVVNPNKPGKFRLVFDAAAKTSGICFNDRMLTGPDLLRPLQAVLWNFRRHPVVLCGDIEDMFHRVYIRDEDRCAQRILWKGCDDKHEIQPYEMMAMTFGSTCSPSCAIYVKDRNADLFAERYPHAVNIIKTDMYCDDLLSGASSPDEAIQLRQEISDINHNGGFVMKKWISNSHQVMKSIPEDLRLHGSKSLSSKGNGLLDTERLLGMWWDPTTDKFTFRLNFNKVSPEVIEGRHPTKREMCSLIMSLFDPLGIVAHFRIKAMIQFQRVWASGVDWDDPIPGEIHDEWKKWLVELRDITGLQMPRCYSLGLGSASIQLHTMVDASSEAMCAICYLRIEVGGYVEVSFVSSSVHVVPLKKSTIPRHELDAAVNGCKLANKIKKELKVNLSSCHYWSDSSTVLIWIKSEATRFKEYVANRIAKIQRLSEPSEWNWVGTADNVADDGTRSSKKTDLSSESRWLRGPDFLRKSPEEWPKKSEQEIGSVSVNCGNENIGTVSTVPSVGKGVEEIPDINRFSRYYRLVRATAAVAAAVKFWIGKLRGNVKVPSPWKYEGGEIISQFSTEEILKAETRLIRAAQQDLNKEELTNLSRTFKLTVDDDGLIRVNGRIQNADCIDETSRAPILLPSRHKLADLIIDHEHVMNGHCGRNTVYNTLRQKYWIPDGRFAVRRSWTRCNLCKIKRAKPDYPEMGNLPKYRLAGFEPPFTYTGVDMFGPVEVTVGRRHEKRWGMLLTCMVSRAIHLEVTAGISGDETMLALSRFVDCRGVPRHFYSDNGTNFQAVSKEVKKREKFYKSDWHFIPAASPHMGGAWETMVKQVKKVLEFLLKDKYPRDQVLHTTLKAVENIVNSRPLSYVSGDADDPEALTPNHFLRGIGVAAGSISSQEAASGSGFFGEDVDVDKERWGKLWEKAQCLANKFWERWSKEVLPDLLRKDKWNATTEPVQEGEVVIMIDELKPRREWIKAIVTKIFPGSDGIVRVVEVTSRGPDSKSSSTFKRAVAKICRTGIRCGGLSTAPEEVSKPGGRKWRKF